MEFQFAVLSDPHVTLLHTLRSYPGRMHMLEVSVAALEAVLDHLSQLDLAFLLIPGDLTQHGEPDNHAWLGERLAKLPFPAYVVPGNHDVPVWKADGYSIDWRTFPDYYRQAGYGNTDQLYYSLVIHPGVRLIALNSNTFDACGQLVGRVDPVQLAWLEATLAAAPEPLKLVMIHHNLLEHLPGQSLHAVGRRYLLENRAELLELLRPAGVSLAFTGHLHIQDVAESQDFFDITTGSLVSYPHPYRLIQVQQTAGRTQVRIRSHRVTQTPDYPDLQTQSREWMAQRSAGFMLQFLMHPPLNLAQEAAQPLIHHLSYFWAEVAQGDARLYFPQLPERVRAFFEGCSDVGPADNHLDIYLHAQGGHTWQPSPLS